MNTLEAEEPAEDDVFFREYSSRDAILKYTRATAGFGISHLLENDYKKVYLRALDQLAPEVRRQPLSVLEFGCGAGMNLVNLMSFYGRQKMEIARAIGTDFSPVLIDAARREAQSYLGKKEQERVEFYVAKNETLGTDLAAALGVARSELANSFQSFWA